VIQSTTLYARELIVLMWQATHVKDDGPIVYVCVYSFDVRVTWITYIWTKRDVIHIKQKTTKIKVLLLKQMLIIKYNFINI